MDMADFIAPASINDPAAVTIINTVKLVLCIERQTAYALIFGGMPSQIITDDCSFHALALSMYFFTAY